MKEKDNLEEFIQKNRDAFDDAVPSLDVWAAIDKQLSVQATPSSLTTKNEQKGRIRRLRRISTIAASVVILLAIGAILGRQIQSDPLDHFAADDSVLREVEDMRHYYEAEIENKEAQLVRYNESSTVTPDLEQIDEQLKELMQEMKEVPAGSEEQVINAMINNYQTKIAILEKVLNSLSNKNEKNNKTLDNETNI